MDEREGQVRAASVPVQEFDWCGPLCSSSFSLETGDGGDEPAADMTGRGTPQQPRLEGDSLHLQDSGGGAGDHKVCYAAVSTGRCCGGGVVHVDVEV